MNARTDWNPPALLDSPILAPLHPLIAQLHLRQFPNLNDLNELSGKIQPQIHVQRGYALRFVPQEPGRLGFESQYEPRCYLTGEVQTRPENWHDLFNAMVWLTYPKAKAAINFRHFQALNEKPESGKSQRGKVRDMATLLDESGIIVVSSNVELIGLLQTFQWKELFWHRREQARKEMGFYVFGHGLYEKALRPYIGMTGQGLIIQTTTDFFTSTMQEQVSEIDSSLAKYMVNPENCLSPRELNPIPLLGVPGWSEENSKETYYENIAYFRPGRREA